METYPPDDDDPMHSLPRRTAKELARLYHRAPTPELRAAIWEVYRLRRLLVRIQRMLDDREPGGLRDKVSLVRQRIDAEPCVHETGPKDTKGNRARWARENTHHAQDRLAAIARGDKV